MLILTIFIFLLLSAFFSGSEIAFISSSKLGIEVKKNKGSKKGAILSRFFDDPKQFLGTMLIGNNIALVILTYFMTQFLSSIFIPSVEDGPLLLLINTTIITLVVLIFGEFLPKTIFRLFSDEALYILARPLSFFKVLLAPLTWVINKFSNGILKYILRAPLEAKEDELTRLDLEHYVADSIKEGEDKIDHEIFSNVLNLNLLRVRDCMIPRNEIVFIDKDVSISELLLEFKNSGHSRLPVIDGDIENIIGYIHHAQLLDNPKSITNLILDIPFVPEVLNSRDLLLRFIKQRTNIACVVDEFGGTSGLITLEDILEEIFGEIEDEHDTEDFVEEQISDREFLFSGRLELSYLNEKYQQLEIEDGEYHTISGYVVMTSGSIPEEGATLVLDDKKFTLEKVSDTKIELIRILLPPSEEAE